MRRASSWKGAQQFWPPTPRSYSAGRVIREHDVILLRQRQPGRATERPKAHLSPPLLPDKKIKLSHGATISGADLIGRHILDIVKDSSGRDVHLREADLASYVVLTRREYHATPIYPQDANLIVNLLDLALPVPGEDPDTDAAPPVEILEAGTGLGSLTLHLAHAIHGANPAVPPALRDALCAAPYAGRAEIEGDGGPEVRISSHEQGCENEPIDSDPHLQELPTMHLSQYKAHLASRRAIIQTLDVSALSSRAAHRLIRRFRRAQYLLNVSFHVSTVRAYLSRRLGASNRKPFLSHAVLDLPDVEQEGEMVARALKPNGSLVIFCPSVSQIADFVATKPATLVLEKVLEVPLTTSLEAGPRPGTGGVEWDVRLTKVRKDVRGTSNDEGVKAAASEIQGRGDAPRRVVVCRKKVGALVSGGGFVAVFRRVNDRAPAQSQEPAEEAMRASTVGMWPSAIDEEGESEGVGRIGER